MGKADLQIKCKKTENQNTKWAKDIHKQTLHKEWLQMVNKYTEKCLTSLLFKEMKVKTAVNYHNPSDWQKIKSQTQTLAEM